MKIIIVFNLLISMLCAHPHVFIDVYTNIDGAKDKIDTIKFKWKLDEMTSSMLMMEFDVNADNKIDKEEDTFIKENYFMPLQDYKFFTFITNKNRPVAYTPADYFTSIENGRICHNFSITLNLPKNDLKIAIYDQDFLAALILKKEFVKSSVAYSIKEIDNEFYFGYELVF